MKRIENRLESLFPDMVSWRRHLHQNPELSFHELKTSSYIASHLQEWGIEVKTEIGGHGVIGIISGEFPGPTVAIRADIDALPIQDEKICDYSSKIKGVMHACGHDGHTAALLAVAKAFSEHRSLIKGTIVLIFQPAEELSPGGAQAMIRDGVLNGVDVIYGVHLWSQFPYGSVFSKSGPMMAAADEFIIGIEGKGGHGGLPHQAIDSIVIGSHLIVNLQTIVSRAVDPTTPCVVSVGSFHGGSGFNIIAEKSSLNGTVRTFDPVLRTEVAERVGHLVKMTCEMFGAKYTMEYKWGYPPVINHEEEANRYYKVSSGLFGQQNSMTSPLIMAGEDFSYYLNEIPGCFMFVGAGNLEQGIVYPHHHPKFDIDERAMLISANLLAHMVADFGKF